MCFAAVLTASAMLLLSACAGAQRQASPAHRVEAPRRSVGEKVAGNAFGVPLGIVGFAVMLPICIPADIYLLPASLKDRESLDTAVACHMMPASVLYCAGYDAGSYPYRDGPSGCL